MKSLFIPKMDITRKGTLQDWNDGKGFGFIVPEEPGGKVFAHVNDFKCPHPRPIDGDAVLYQTRTGSDGRIRAVGIQRPSLDKARGPMGFSLFAGLIFAVWIGLGTRIGSYPLELSIVLAFMSLISYTQYASDKRRALRKRFRVPEARLHLVDLLGGWPGGLLAQRRFQHKTSKTRFQIIFILTVFLNIAILVHIAAEPGAWKQHRYQEYVPALLKRVELLINGLS